MDIHGHVLFWHPTTAIQGRVPWNTPGAQLTKQDFIHSRNCGIARYGKYRLTMAYSWILSYSIHGQTRVVPFLASCCWGIREGLLNELLLLRLLARAPRHPHLCRLGMQGMSTKVFLNILESNEKNKQCMISKRNFMRKVSSFRAPHSKHQGLSLINVEESSTSIQILPLIFIHAFQAGDSKAKIWW